MREFHGLEGSLKQPQVVGLPDTGTDVNESACPFDLESPVMVWRTGMRVCPHVFRRPRFNVFASKDLAWARRCDQVRSPSYYQFANEPYAVTFEEACIAAKEFGATVLIVKYATKEDKYPL